jgi:hypothetical protein
MNFDGTGIMDDPIQDGISQGRFPDLSMPASGGKLGTKDG